MRILFMTQVLPFPLDAGPKVRAYHVIRYLAEAGHDVHLLSFARREPEELIQPLRRICASVNLVPIVRSRARDVRDGVRSILTGMPFLVLRDHVAAMRRKVDEIAGRMSFDAQHLDQLWMAPYGLGGVRAGRTVLDQHNAVFMVPRRMAERQRNPIGRALLQGEATRLQRYERNACQALDHVVWVTEEDRRAVLPPSAESAADRNTVIPIATDPALLSRIERTRPFRVTFLGGMHWPPNAEGVSWFAQRVWPQIARQVPSAVLTVIGKGGAQALPGLAEPRVEITGYVDDPRRYLAETAVFVVPLWSGAGMRVKILDAWCWGLPIVSTTLGAEGLAACNGENMLLADDEASFAESVVRVFRDRRVAGALADGGRATVESYYDWKKIYTAWDAVYQA
jgi:polysaccharide biosynthesis protein PslH